MLKPMPFRLLSGSLYHCTPRWRRAVAETDRLHRLYWPLAGEAWIERAGQRHILDDRRLHLIPAHQPVRYGCARSFDLRYLHFTPTDAATDLHLGRLDHVPTWPLEAWASWGRWFERMEELFNVDPPQELGCRIQALLLCLIGDLSPQLERIARTTATGLGRLNEALAYMDRHYLDNPPLSAIARRAHLSPTHFHRRFRQAMGITPRRYMLTRRMARAHRLLQQGMGNVSEVAELTGFKSVYHFSRVFSQYHGYRPSDVREGRVEASP